VVRRRAFINSSKSNNFNYNFKIIKYNIILSNLHFSIKSLFLNKNNRLFFKRFNHRYVNYIYFKNLFYFKNKVILLLKFFKSFISNLFLSLNVFIIVLRYKINLLNKFNFLINYNLLNNFFKLFFKKFSYNNIYNNKLKCLNIISYNYYEGIYYYNNLLIL
jgi:hypothetical protein